MVKFPFWTLKSTPSDSGCDWLPGNLLEVACVGLGCDWMLKFPSAGSDGRFAPDARYPDSASRTHDN